MKTMRIKDGFLLREVAGSFIVVPVGAAAMDFGGMMTLNPVGAFVWKAMETDTDENAVVEKILAEYEIDRDTAARDVHIYVEKLRAAGLLED